MSRSLRDTPPREEPAVESDPGAAGASAGDLTAASAVLAEQPELFLGYEQHEAAALFELMEGDEFDALCNAIRAIGLATPIVLHDGKVLEGRNRCRAIEQLRAEGRDIEPRYIEWQPVGDETPYDYVLAVNGPRRHQTNDQRIATACKYLPVLREQSKQRQQASRFRSGDGDGSRSVAKDSQPPRKRDSRAKNENSTAGQLAAKCFISLHMANQVIELEKAVRQGKLPASVITDVAKGAKLSKVLAPVKASTKENRAEDDKPSRAPAIGRRKTARVPGLHNGPGRPIDPSNLWGDSPAEAMPENEEPSEATSPVAATKTEDDLEADINGRWKRLWDGIVKDYAVTDYARIREILEARLRESSGTSTPKPPRSRSGSKSQKSPATRS